jgi:fructokinase
MDVLLDGGGRLAYSGIGGSTGNVLSILAFLGWESVPLVNLGRDRVGAAIHREFSAMGADVTHMRLERTLTSPLLYQFSGDPSQAPRYSFGCPVCGRTRKFNENLVDTGGSAFERCAADSNVFFFDRVTSGTVRMAAAARAGGSLVFFEPSEVSPNRDLFMAALKTAHVVKYSADRIPEPFTGVLSWGFIEIQTQGARGLRFRKHSLAPDWVELPALRSSWVADTSGAGDWCTAGFLHALLAGRKGVEMLDASYNEVYESLRLGQSIAALSVAHVGARGLMRARGSDDTLFQALQVLKGACAATDLMSSVRDCVAVDTICCEAVTNYVRPRPTRVPLPF